MRIVLHNQLSIDDPDEKVIDHAFDQLHEGGDFIRLMDPAYGEVRAAGPYQGDVFLVQCDLPLPGEFHGELNSVPRARTIGFFKRFIAGDISWGSEFQQR